MADSMRAVVLHGAGDARLEERPVPTPSGDEVLLRITGAGICGTDAGFYTHGREAFGMEGPVVLGHEFGGVVEAVGPEVTRFSIGDQVASGGNVSCGECEPCRRGRTNLCDSYRTAGINFDGGLAEYCAVSEQTCEPAPAHGLHGDAVALSQPMAIAHHSVTTGKLGPGDEALIIGVGGVGLFATWIACQLGANVTAVDVEADRLALATKLGAARIVQPGTDGLYEELADGGSARWDVIYEASGGAAPLADAIRLARKGTRLVLIGIQKQPLELNATRLIAEEIELAGSAAQVKSIDLPAAMDLLAARADGWADVAPTVLPLDRVIEDGLVALAERRAGAVKVLVDPRIEEARPYQA
jgi:(R,R)-butanediol dehydrogenase/meso-butanediol dehydrogenase/diacetyl reductase